METLGTQTQTPLSSYAETIPGLRRDFRLYSDRVDISGLRLSSFITVASFTITVPLLPINSAFQVVRTYSNMTMWVVLIFLASLIGLVAAFYFSAPEPVVLGLLGASLLTFVWAIRVGGKFTAYQFLDNRLSNHLAFDVAYYWRKHKASCEEFVAKVVAAISELQGRQASQEQPT
jgi:hypothetical protein